MVKVLHLEPTSACQAACPQCARENPDLFDKSQRSELTVDSIVDLVGVDFIKRLDKMFMCGNFGDPAASKHALEIFRYFRELNPTITLGLNTNGGLRQTSWWAELASILNQPYDYCVFSIDGLEDTNHIYRRHVMWRIVMENADAFIKAGGSAHWDMLVYQHNEHQVDEAEALAKEMGFTWFRAKVTRRFDTVPVDSLQLPVNFGAPVMKEAQSIKCHALEEESQYIAANSKLYPCCWLGTQAFIEDEPPTFGEVIGSWHSEPLEICTRTCGVTVDTESKFTQQWVRNEQLR